MSSNQTNQTKYQYLRQFISKYIGGPNTDALLNSWADDAQRQEDLSVAVTDQLTICTSSGIYLDKQLGQLAIIRPPDLGMSDTSFRQMGIQINAQKQIIGIVEAVLQTFYGDSAVRAWCQSGQNDPYNLADGDDLILEVEDGVQRTLNISANDFADVSQATAAELASVITQFFTSQGLNAYAQEYTNPQTGLNYVQIFGGAIGPYSIIKVDGGIIQDVLEFPLIRDTRLASNTTVWQITKTKGNTLRFLWYSGPQPTLDNVFVGDSALIYGSGFESFGLSGTFVITNVRPPQASPNYTSGWFEISNPNATFLTGSQPGIAPPVNTPTNTYSVFVSQENYNDLKFFLPKKNTPYSQVRYALAWEPARELLKIYMPAVTQVVTRALIGGAHMHLLYPVDELNGSFGSASVPAQQIEVVNDYSIRYPMLGHDCTGYGGTLNFTGAPLGGIDISYVNRYQGKAIVVCAEPHGIVGYNQWQASTPYITGTQVFYAGQYWEAIQNSGPGYGGAQTPVDGAYWNRVGSGLNLASTVVSVEIEQFSTDDPLNPFLGAYMPDLTANYNLTSQNVTTRQTIVAGTRVQALYVNGTLPNEEGTILFGLNTDEQEGPVRYLASQTATSNIIAPIVNASQNGYAVTVTCSSAHGAIPGEQVVVAGNSNNALNGTYTVSEVPSLTTYVAISNISQIAYGTGGTSTTVVGATTATLVLDPSYTFKYNHDVGELVNLLAGSTAYVPNPDGSDYSFYITGTADALTFAEQIIDQITAAGIKLEIVIVYPSGVGLGNEQYPANGAVTPHSDVVWIWGTD